MVAFERDIGESCVAFVFTGQGKFIEAARIGSVAPAPSNSGGHPRDARRASSSAFADPTKVLAHRRQCYRH